MNIQEAQKIIDEHAEDFADMNEDINNNFLGINDLTAEQELDLEAQNGV